MQTRPMMIPSNETDLLFDDRSLLAAAFGKDALKVASANANCDCVSHSSTADDEDLNSDQVPPIAHQTY